MLHAVLCLILFGLVYIVFLNKRKKKTQTHTFEWYILAKY